MLPEKVVIKKSEFTELEMCESEEEFEEELSELLSDTYGFLHNGFSYVETEDEIIITHIEWELDDEEDYEDCEEEDCDD